MMVHFYIQDGATKTEIQLKNNCIFLNFPFFLIYVANNDQVLYLRQYEYLFILNNK
jgi:hypothetical protein